ncbi:MAG: alpha/beta fold hydrolase [Chloroflexi bacterium]|nr:MAG: alpha/beta fold hydrolase [Chloroflexota bacterium]
MGNSMMAKKRSFLSRVLRGIGIGVGVIIVLLYLGLPAGFGAAAVFPGRAAVDRPPEGFREVAFRAEDGVQLKGWYRPPENGAVIILLHGAGGSRDSVRSYVKILVKHGYGILALDLRGHGASQGKTNRLGWQGTLDVGAAVNFLQGLGEVRRIGGLGISMGGEVLLGAASAYPAIRAMAADGATRRCTDELLALETERPLVRNFTARVMYATVQLLSGDPQPKPLLESMHASGAQILLIAGGSNALEVSFNQMFKDTLGNRVDLWIAPEAGHTQAYALYPEEYEQRLTKFFDQTLLQDDRPSDH